MSTPTEPPTRTEYWRRLQRGAVVIVRRSICRILGHKWVFTHLAIPRQMHCATCGKLLRKYVCEKWEWEEVRP